MKNIFAKSVLALTLSLFTAQQANAFMLYISAIDPYGSSMGLTVTEKALVIGVAFLIHPITGIAMLLDDNANAYEAVSQKFIEAGAPREEAQDLAIVIVDAANKAIQSGQANMVIPADQVAAAAPIFSKSANFEALLKQAI